jgi:hypothetical protein
MTGAGRYERLIKKGTVTFINFINYSTRSTLSS